MYFLFSKAGNFETSITRVPYNKLLTNLACSSRTGEYWPSVVFVRTSLRSVRTATTSGQYSPVRPSRSVSKRLLFLRVVPYFDEPVGRVKIQRTSKNPQRYYTTKRLKRDLLSNTPNCYVHVRNFADIYLWRICDRSMRSETCLTGPLEYKYRVIFVLVSGIICTLRSAVG